MKENSDKKMLLEMMHKVGGMPLNENYPMGAEPEYAGDDAPYNQDDNYENNEPDPDEGRDDDLSENNEQDIKYNVIAKDGFLVNVNNNIITLPSFSLYAVDDKYARLKAEIFIKHVLNSNVEEIDIILPNEKRF